MKLLPLTNGGVGAARRAAFVASIFFLFGVAARAQSGTALVQHAPTINGTSVVNGSLQQMGGENVTLNGSASVSGDLLVPGTPKLTLNGHPSFGGTITGTGSASPSNYTVTLNGNPSLGHLRTRTNPVSLPTVAAPPAPQGTRDVALNSPGQSVGNFSTLRNLTLNGNIGQVAVPPGTYGVFTANSNGGFTLGVAGAAQPAIYNLQGLTLNSSSQLQIVGPIVLTLASGLTLNGTAGTSAHPEWLTLKIASGSVTLNGNVVLYGLVTASASAVTLNANSQLIGGLIASQLTLNGNSLLRVQGAVSKPAPVAADQSVTTLENTPVAITLTATQANGDPLTYTAGAPSHGTLTGTAPSLTYTPTTYYSGPDSFTFTAKDGALSSNPATVSITVNPYTALLEIMMPANGCSEKYARPSLGAHYAGTTPVQPDSFHVYLDGHDFSSEATIDSGEVMFMPLFDLDQGQHNYRIDWVYNGKVVATDNSTFTVNSVIPGGGTYFQGQVDATTGEPLVNVRVVAANQQTFTDVNGKFSFTNLPAGRTIFHFQTDAVTNAGQFTPVNLSFDVLEDENTVWDRPIYLVAFDPSQGVMVQSNSSVDQVVTNPTLPGVKLVIPANTELAFPDGSAQGVVTIVNVPVDRAPNCLGPGFRPARLISIQPENTILSQPARLTFPNDLNLPDGAKLSLRNLDIASGQFVVTGTATVVNNTLVTDPGSGITTFDWGDIGPSEDSIGSTPTDSASVTAKKDVVCSSMSPLEGSLEEDHFTPAYQSLGVTRSIQLHYSSRVAAPDVVSADTALQATNIAQPTVTRFSATSPAGGSASYYHVPSELSYVSATRTDFSGMPTGKTPLTLRVSSYYPNSNDPSGYSVFSNQQVVQAATINGAEIYPALGSGWAIGNIDRLTFGSNRTVYLVNGGKAAMSTFVQNGFSNNLSNSNLGFELGTLDGYIPSDVAFTAGAINAVRSLGSVLPPEGKYMAQINVAPVLNARASLTLPFTSLPTGTTQITLSLDVLAGTLLSDTHGFVVVSYNYNNNTLSPRFYASSTGETVLAGADTGYARRTGFQTLIFDIPPDAWGQPGSLKIAVNSLGVFEGSGTQTAIAIAALVDDIQIKGKAQVPGSTITYSGDNGDYSTFTFDPSTNQYQRLFKDGSKETFDQQGREISFADRQGNTTTYAYTDATGSGKAFDLASVTDPVGSVTNLSYAGGKLDRITDPAGRSTSFAYDSSGDLIKITNPDGTTRAFTYDTNGRMTSQSDGKGQTRTYTYGPFGRIVQVKRADGSIYKYTPALVAGLPSNGTNNSFSAPVAPILSQTQNIESAPLDNPVYHTTDANGNPTSKEMNQNGQPTKVTDALGQVATINYDTQRNPSSLTWPNNDSVTFSYDAMGNILTATQAANSATSTFTYTSDFNLVKTATDPLGRTTNYSYDPSGNLTQVTDQLGQSVTMTYNSHGQVLSRTDQRGSTTNYSYDSFGRVTSVTDALNRTTTTTYDNAGNVASVTDPLGHVTSYLYNPNGKVTQITAPDGGVTRFTYDANDDLVQVTDPLGHSKTTAYDVRRRPVSVTDALNQTTRMFYDGVDNLLSVTDPKNGITNYTYDSLNRKIAASDPKGNRMLWAYDTVGNITQITRPDIGTITNSYDLLNRLTQTRAPDGATTSYTYDNDNEVTNVTDPLNGVVKYVYDQDGRRTDVIDQLSRDTQSAYDPAGNLITLTRPDNTATSYVYDAANQRTQMTAADGGVTAYAYDNDGNLVLLTDPDGHNRQFGYDALNRPTSETDPLGHTRQKTYDVAGHLTSLTRKDGAVINYTYDALNRLVGKTLPAIGSVPGDTVTMGYDALGNLASAANNAATIANTYDADSLLTQTSETVAGNAQVLSYAYDVMNRRSQMTDAVGQTSYTYDNRDRLTQLVDPHHRTFSFAYDPLSRMTSKAYPNGVNASYAYDAASQLLGLADTLNAQPSALSSVTYTYDTVGRRTSETREDSNSRNFNYDPVDRVLASVSSAPSVFNSESFAYDQVGNWTINSRQHDADNKLTSDASYNYSYDVEGNLTQKASTTNPTDVTAYAYDAENNLVQVTVGSPVTSTIFYQYDALGRRIAKTVNGVTTRYVLDSDNVRLELNSGGQVIAANTESGLDQLLVRDSSTGTYFVHTDGLGSTTALTDSSGNVVERYRYSSFGQLSVLAADYSLLATAPKVPETYTGREWDNDAGIYFYRARFYSPFMGRFLSQDPLGYAAGINYYSYCANNPLLLTDPLGLDGLSPAQQLQQATQIRDRNLAIVQSYTGYNSLSNLDAGSTAGAVTGLAITVGTMVHNAQPLSTEGQLGTTVFRSDQNANIFGTAGNGLAVAGAGVDAYSALKDFREGDTNGAVLNSANVGADLTSAALSTPSIVASLGLNGTELAASLGVDSIAGPAGLVLGIGQLAANSYVTIEEAIMAKDTANANIQAALQIAQLAQAKIDELNKQSGSSPPCH